MTKALGDRIRHARIRRGLSQSELARLVEAPPSSIGNLEQGLSKTARKAVQIARALRVRPEWLATGALPMEAYNAEVSEATLKLARRIEQLSAPQVSVISALIDSFITVMESEEAASPRQKVMSK